jgi:hypothetical protein
MIAAAVSLDGVPTVGTRTGIVQYPFDTSEKEHEKQLGWMLGVGS